MLEKLIEKYLVLAVKKRGGLALKFVSPGISGVPDRIVLLPGRRIAFIEVKAPREQMRPLQKKRKKQLEKLGFMVYCLDDAKMIEGMLDEICTA
ncbi:MAG: VRR-NUC domain-containing protein [Deltaproteobacteria bacterium]